MKNNIPPMPAARCNNRRYAAVTVAVSPKFPVLLLKELGPLSRADVELLQSFMVTVLQKFLSKMNKL